MRYHGAEARGFVPVDVSGGGAVDPVAVPSRPVPTLIWLHAICMMLSWGFLLPLGVILSRYYKQDPRVVYGKPFWFRGHQTCQYSGVLLMLLGFFFLAAHKGVFNCFRLRGPGTLHMLFGDLVVILGFAQPFIAYVRPPAHKDHDPTRTFFNDKRIRWEKLHHTTGYVALALGMYQCVGTAPLMVSPLYEKPLYPYDWKLWAFTRVSSSALTLPLVVAFAVKEYLKRRSARVRQSTPSSVNSEKTLGLSQSVDRSRSVSLNQAESVEPKPGSSERHNGTKSPELPLVETF
jgi:hypothetical protein